MDFFLHFIVKIYIIFGHTEKGSRTLSVGTLKIQNTSDVMEWPESCFVLKDAGNLVWHLGQVVLILLTESNFVFF